MIVRPTEGEIMQNTKLLAVDDNSKNLHVLRRVIDLPNVEVVGVQSGKEALREILHNEFFLVLMDVQMLEMDGFETASLILQNPKTAHVPIIFMTAISRDEHLPLEGYDIGAVDFIYKPFDPFVLNSKISVFQKLWLQREQLQEKSRLLGRLNQKLEDTHAELKRSNGKLLHISQRDALTGLANRRYFLSALEKALARAQRNSGNLAVFFLDLDHFKDVNDTLGHDAGDELLVVVAQRLCCAVRTGDMVCRLGGDEFAVLTENIKENFFAADIAQHMLDVVGLPASLKGHAHEISPSIGISIYPENGEDGEQLIKAADIAMYRAKKSGRNNYQFFNTDLNTMAGEHARLAEDLARAQMENEFEVYYQAQFEAGSGSVVGLEALLRWNHPTKGLISADQFIFVAERSDLMQTLGEWVFATASQQFGQWSEAGLIDAAVVLDVNISAGQLHHKTLPETIISTLGSSVVSGPSLNLDLDIDETVVSDSYEHCREVMGEINKLGVGLSIDNFGTGPISYTQLQRLPIDTLKIDRSLIVDLLSNKSTQDWVKAMVYMGRALNASVMAKGVEDERQQSLLVELGVNQVQGFHCARPLPAEKTTRLLEEGVKNQLLSNSRNLDQSLGRSQDQNQDQNLH